MAPRSRAADGAFAGRDSDVLAKTRHFLSAPSVARPKIDGVCLAGPAFVSSVRLQYSIRAVRDAVDGDT
jgi:hypothetical protein